MGVALGFQRAFYVAALLPMLLLFGLVSCERNARSTPSEPVATHNAADIVAALRVERPDFCSDPSNINTIRGPRFLFGKWFVACEAIWPPQSVARTPGGIAIGDFTCAALSDSTLEILAYPSTNVFRNGTPLATQEADTLNACEGR
ncbi:MAG TPA: hypothetical protein VEZ14_08530 [Dehalococcoidia bacterium]|nr:hypothetical protein [Dehalococcoidia bacterium]